MVNQVDPDLLSLDQLERDLKEMAFDRGIIGDFLADAHAAALLNSRPLLLSLFRWVRTYHAARGMKDKDLDRLVQALAGQIHRSVPISLEGDVSILAAQSGGWRQRAPGQPRPTSEVLQTYMNLLLNHEGAEARRLILEKAVDGKSVQYLYGHVLESTMTEIGRLWLENKIDVADEHYATAVTEALMNSLHPMLKQRPRRGRVLLVGVQTELHALGLHMVKDFLELDGWDTTYLGPNLPLESICSAIEKERPDLIAISVTTPANLIPTAQAIQRIREIPTAGSIPLMVGGYPILVDPSLHATLGADAWAANGFHAVRVARSLLNATRPPRIGSPETAGLSAELTTHRVHRSHKVTPNEELVRLVSELSALHAQLRKRNVAIEQLSEEKSRFLGMAAHDLRNDINVATLIARLLGQRNEGFSEFQRSLVERLDNTLKSMLDLVDGYLDVSRIEAGKLEIHAEPIDLIALVEDRLSVARFFGDEAGVRIVRSGIPGPAMVNVDPKRIKQALNNLLINAIKFSPHGGEVEAAVHEHGDRYVLDVMDEGPGVPSEEGKRLFAPFTTLDPAGEKSGTGLGLHIARRVVEAHGGSIEFRSRSPRGAIFSIALPRFTRPA